MNDNSLLYKALVSKVTKSYDKESRPRYSFKGASDFKLSFSRAWNKKIREAYHPDLKVKTFVTQSCIVSDAHIKESFTVEEREASSSRDLLTMLFIMSPNLLLKKAAPDKMFVRHRWAENVLSEELISLITNAAAESNLYYNANDATSSYISFSSDEMKLFENSIDLSWSLFDVPPMKKFISFGSTEVDFDSDSFAGIPQVFLGYQANAFNLWNLLIVPDLIEEWERKFFVSNVKIPSNVLELTEIFWSKMKDFYLTFGIELALDGLDSRFKFFCMKAIPSSLFLAHFYLDKERKKLFFSSFNKGTRYTLSCLLNLRLPISKFLKEEDINELLK